MAHRAHDYEERRAAKKALRYQPAVLTGMQAKTVAEGFAWAAEEGEYLIHACAVLPEHIHLVVGRHSRDIRRIIAHMKARATRLLQLRSQWPTDGRPVWGEHGWNVFLNDAGAVEGAIKYVEENLLKEGKRLQRWSFVVPFNASAALAMGRRRERASQATRRN